MDLFYCDVCHVVYARRPLASGGVANMPVIGLPDGKKIKVTIADCGGQMLDTSIYYE
jgi:hypothetical protein